MFNFTQNFLNDNNNVKTIFNKINDYFNDFSCFQDLKEGIDFQKHLLQNPLLLSQENNKVLNILQSISKLNFCDMEFFCYSLFCDDVFIDNQKLDSTIQKKQQKKYAFYFLFLDSMFSLLEWKKKNKTSIFYQEFANYDNLISVFEKGLFDIVKSNDLKTYFEVLMQKTLFKMLMDFQDQNFQKTNKTMKYDTLNRFHFIFEKNFLNKFNIYQNLWFEYFSFSNNDFFKSLNGKTLFKDNITLPSNLIRTESFFKKSQKYKFELNEFFHYQNLKLIKKPMDDFFKNFWLFESIYCLDNNEAVKKIQKNYHPDIVLFFKQLIYSDVMDFFVSSKDDYMSYFVKNNCKINFSNYRNVFLKSIKNFYLNYERLREHFYFTESLLNFFKLKSEDKSRINAFINLFKIFDFEKELNKNLDNILYLNNHKDLTYINITFETLLFTVLYYDNPKSASLFISKETLDKFLNVMEKYLDFSFDFYLAELFSNETIEDSFSKFSCRYGRRIFSHVLPNCYYNVDYDSKTLDRLLDHNKIFEENISTINAILYDCVNYLKYNIKDLSEVKNILHKLLTIFNFWKIKDNNLFSNEGALSHDLKKFLLLIVKLNNLFNIKLHSKHAFLFMFYHFFTKNNMSLNNENFNVVFSKTLSSLVFKDDEFMFDKSIKIIINFLNKHSRSFVLIKYFDIHCYEYLHNRLEKCRSELNFTDFNFIKNMLFELRISKSF